MVINSYKRFENESEEELIYRICQDKDVIGSWTDVADILNELLNYEYTESKYRKQYQSFQKMLTANQAKFADTEACSEELEMKMRELERLKIKYRDERNAWQKQNYIDARVEQKLDYLEEELTSIGKVDFGVKQNQVTYGDDTDLFIMLSDWHIGQCFSSNWGSYNSDIAKDRIGQLLDEINVIGARHKSKNAFLSIQGDLISSSIHKVLAITNRENVIEQVKLATELIASFCDELSESFENVFITNVSGNHSRIDRKDDALHDERLDDLIGWALEKCLAANDKITFLHSNLDTGISVMNIRGKKYVNVHGDYDSFAKSGVSNLCMYLGFIPYAVTFGHMHTCAVDENNGVKMIRGGSLAGSGDNYTVEKRLSGKPSQMVCVCDERGVQCYYAVELV